MRFSEKNTRDSFIGSTEKTLGFIEKIEAKREIIEKAEEEINKVMKEEKEQECEPLETLKRLADLQKQGIITEEEFKTKKKGLLREV